MTNNISITGFGWLGNILGVHFKEKGYNIHASTTTPEKTEKIRAKGLIPYVFRMEDRNFPADFMNADIHIICIPPSKTSHDFLSSLQHYLKQLKPETTLFLISSTGVYPAISGTYKEDSTIVPGKMADIEKMVQTTVTNHYILRCGGLFGPERDPGRFLIGKTGIEGPLSTVNLVHANDICFVIEKLISIKNFGVFNVCAQSPINKEEFYTAAAKNIGQTIPVFIDNSSSVQRIISNNKIASLIGIEFTNTHAFFSKMMHLSFGKH